MHYGGTLLINEISPLDGRYHGKLVFLSEYFSEFALMRTRCRIELLYLEVLAETGLWEGLSGAETKRLHAMKGSFTEEDFHRIKAIEGKIHHDVKACELFLRETLDLCGGNMIHFGLTSEDVNNLAYSSLFKEFREREQIPLLKEVIGKLCALAVQWKSVPFPARTHGQMASPTTAGKELAVYISRLLRQLRRLKELRFRGKLNGATGNFSAFTAAFPDFDWLEFSANFVRSLDLEPNIATTQIEDHDTWAEYFLIVKQIHNILIDFDRDMWLYLTLGYMSVVAHQQEVGSSTMPHKVNPINFENSEGNLEVANHLLGGLADRLTRSRLQRDLSDSTVTRNVGVALAHGILAQKEILKGLTRLRLNEEQCRQELEGSPELLTEPIQTILRREGVVAPYEKLKQLSRGRKPTLRDIHDFITELDVGEPVKEELRSLQVPEYTGYAARICQLVLDEANRELAL